MVIPSCWNGAGSTSAPWRPVRPVPAAIVRPDYVTNGVVGTSRRTQLHDDASLRRHRRACEVAAEVLLRTGAAVEVGVTTDELDAVAHGAYVDLGAYPSTLGYPSRDKTPSAKSICTSVNGVICHGIPDSRPLADGDAVNIDVTAYIDGMHGDTSAKFVAGSSKHAIDALIETTREATLRGIAAILPHEPLRRIAEAIEPFAASRGSGVIREYGGHGIGEAFHTDLHIHHCIERDDDKMAIPGMTSRSNRCSPAVGRPFTPPPMVGPSASTTTASPRSSNTPSSSPTPARRSSRSPPTGALRSAASTTSPAGPSAPAR